MKIIKHGKPKYINCNDYKLECPNCECIFVFDCGDFISQEKRIDGCATVRCPDCNKEITFIPSKCLYDEDEE